MPEKQITLGQDSEEYVQNAGCAGLGRSDGRAHQQTAAAFHIIPKLTDQEANYLRKAIQI